jgi:hypothetical protein
MAVSTGQEKPFPQATITMTAEHFPQVIVFRLNMMFAGGVMLLLWFCIYWWLQKVNKLIGGPITISPIIIWGGQIGTFFFIMAISTIDDGYMNDDLHSTSAVIFFIVWFLTVNYLTYVMRKLKKFDHRFISDISIWSKMLICSAMLACWAIEIYKSFGPQPPPNNLGIDTAVVVVEWVTTLLICLFFWTFHWDFKEFKLVMQT